MQVSTIGLDLAKNVFQAHGVSAEGKVVLKEQLRRGEVVSTFAKLPPCLVGMEACAGAHYWARELRKLGHDVRLMPARDVKAYVKRDKTDAADAAAICEAVSRPSMRLVALKTPEQQGRLMQQRVRDLLLRQRTQTINALRAHMAELGLVAATGRQGLGLLLAILADAKDERLPQDARASLKLLASQIAALQAQIDTLDKRLHAQHRQCPGSRRLETIPASASSGRQHLPQPSPIPRRSSRGAIWPPSSAWFRATTRAVASSAWVPSPSRATAICGASWSWERIPSSSRRAPVPTSIPGWRGSWRASPASWRRWLSPTRLRASPGPFWHAARATERRRRPLQRARKGLARG